jgi:PAS domain-containing protein
MENGLATILMRPDGEILAFNQTATKLTGYEMDAAKSMNFFEMITEIGGEKLTSLQDVKPETPVASSLLFESQSHSRSSIDVLLTRGNIWAFAVVKADGSTVTHRIRVCVTMPANSSSSATSSSLSSSKRGSDGKECVFVKILPNSF